jgi:hypothetical protein
MSWRTKALLANTRGAATAELALIDAYKEVFGRPGQAREMVMADLATHCRMFQFEERGLSVEDANYINGLRAAFARILQHLSLSESDIAELVEAARYEAAHTEG